MISIAKTSHRTSEEMLRRAVGVAEHYGFMPIESVMPRYGAPRTRGRAPLLQHGNVYDNELAAVLSSYVEHGHAELKEPMLVYHRRASGGATDHSDFFGLHVLGSSHSIAEALLTKTALAILDDIGIKDMCVHVNSIGDRDSANRFAKELSIYLRKNFNEMPAYSRQAMKKDVFHAYDHLLRKQHILCAAAPSAVEFLTEASRQHLREVLEYFEMAEILYELNPVLIGHRDCYSKTLFEIRDASAAENDTTVIYARGGRYDELSRRLAKTLIPAAGILLEYERKGRFPKKIEGSSRRKPKVYFIQLGFEARLRSLVVIEALRKARVPVYQALGKEQLSAQLALAEELAIPYTVIMGHKEALEGSIIVRNMNTRAQDTIPVSRIAEHLKALL